ncbi:MAG: DUF429 domain-containing protein [Acidilobaceae archaeon]
MRRDASLINDEAELRGALKVAGLDLAARPNRCSGYAIIDANSKTVEKTLCLFTDKEILKTVIKTKPEVLAVDAPLSPIPKWREIDRLARRAGFKVMPPTLGSMRDLTIRAWRLYEALSALGITVIETHPSSVLSFTSTNNLLELLDKLKLMCSFCSSISKRDLKDAILAAIVAYCYHIKECFYSVTASDGAIYLVKT